MSLLEIQASTVGAPGPISSTFTVSNDSLEGGHLIYPWLGLVATSAGDCLEDPVIPGTWKRTACGDWVQDEWQFGDDGTVSLSKHYDEGAGQTIIRSGTYCTNFVFPGSGDLLVHFTRECYSQGEALCDPPQDCAVCTDIDENHAVHYYTDWWCSFGPCDFTLTLGGEVCYQGDAQYNWNQSTYTRGGWDDLGVTTCDALSNLPCPEEEPVFVEDEQLTGKWFYQVCGTRGFTLEFDNTGQMHFTQEGNAEYKVQASYTTQPGYLRKELSTTDLKSCYLAHCDDGEWPGCDTSWWECQTLYPSTGVYKVTDGQLEVRLVPVLAGMTFTRDAQCDDAPLRDVLMHYQEYDTNGDGRISRNEAIKAGIAESAWYAVQTESPYSDVRPATLLWLLDNDAPVYTADTDLDLTISLSELLRVVQLYNNGAYFCDEVSIEKDGYALQQPEFAPQDCPPHAADYAPADRVIGLTELLRVLQFYNLGGYQECDNGEDGFCPVTR